MSTRRELLVSLGTLGAAGLAGCSALPFSDDGGDAEVTVPADTVRPYDRPQSPFPVALPATLATRHRDRARELLADVPTDPSIPNAAVADELASERQRVAETVASDTGATWPIEVVAERRHERGNAAAVRATYRAATGEGDPSTVATRLRQTRSDLGSFWGDLAYRGSDPLEAVLVYAAIEDLLVACRRWIHRGTDYPEDPVAEPFAAGDAVEFVEIATAGVADARRFRASHLASAEAPNPQWTAVADSVTQLERDVEQTVESVEQFLEAETEAVFEENLDDTIARGLFDDAARRCRNWRESFEEANTNGRYATAVVEAGRTVAAVEALRTAIEAIRDGGYQEQLSVESVRRVAEQARSNLQRIEGTDSSGLAIRIGLPAIWEYEGAVRTLKQERGYGADYVTPEFAWAALYAGAVPVAAQFVSDRL